LNFADQKLEFLSVSTYNTDQFTEPKEVQEFQTT